MNAYKQTSKPVSAFSRRSRKGQYFSFDAIIASVIFILAISILSAHWFALRAQIDSSSDFLGQDAMRVSDLLLGVGNPFNYSVGAPPTTNWYLSPASASRAGFAVNGSIPEELNATMLQQAEAQVGLNAPRGTAQATAYNQYRSLMALGSQFQVVINTTDPSPLYSNFSFGVAPHNASEIAQAHRVIVIADPATGWHYDGNLTLIIWSNQSQG